MQNNLQGVIQKLSIFYLDKFRLHGKHVYNTTYVTSHFEILNSFLLQLVNNNV